MYEKIIDLKILDSGNDFYTIECDNHYFGRMYDHEATFLKIIFPNFEIRKKSVCKCIFYERLDSNSKIIDQWPSEGKTLNNGDLIPLKNTISQYASCFVKFEFSSADESYFKNSEVKKMRFAYSIKPKEFNPEPPELNKLDILWNQSHTGEIVEDSEKTNKYIFRNAKGEIIATIPLYSSNESIEKYHHVLVDLIENEKLEIELPILKINNDALVKIFASGILDGVQGEGISVDENKLFYTPSFSGNNIKLSIFYKGD